MPRKAKCKASVSLHTTDGTPRLIPCPDKGPSKLGCDALSPHEATTLDQALHRAMECSPANER